MTPETALVFLDRRRQQILEGLNLLDTSTADLDALITAEVAGKQRILVIRDLLGRKHKLLWRAELKSVMDRLTLL